MLGADGDAYDLVFEALAHPARRRILTSLNFAGGAMSAGAIAALFAHAWPTTTRHLQTLERAGLINHRREGRARIYALDRPRLALAGGWLGWFNRDPVTGEELAAHDRNPGHAQPLPAQRGGRRHQ
jgi:DNA-binding transcriptional ArsR family regulator